MSYLRRAVPSLLWTVVAANFGHGGGNGWQHFQGANPHGGLGRPFGGFGHHDPGGHGGHGGHDGHNGHGGHGDHGNHGWDGGRGGHGWGGWDDGRGGHGEHGGHGGHGGHDDPKNNIDPIHNGIHGGAPGGFHGGFGGAGPEKHNGEDSACEPSTMTVTATYTSWAEFVRKLIKSLRSQLRNECPRPDTADLPFRGLL
ncbi:hypothetical protein F4861DRAFT_175645 [Xylaria intraflava]|nr:hypothetical protein F4861DRAFT_175645 [Xylaria intraflava]